MDQHFDGYWANEFNAFSRRSHKYHRPLRDKVNDSERSRRKRPWLFVQDTDQKAATNAALSGQLSSFIFSGKIIHHFMNTVLLQRSWLHPPSKEKWRKAKGISKRQTHGRIEPNRDYQNHTKRSHAAINRNQKWYQSACTRYSNHNRAHSAFNQITRETTRQTRVNASENALPQ